MGLGVHLFLSSGVLRYPKQFSGGHGLCLIGTFKGAIPNMGTNQ